MSRGSPFGLPMPVESGGTLSVANDPVGHRAQARAGEAASRHAEVGTNASVTTKCTS